MFSFLLLNYATYATTQLSTNKERFSFLKNNSHACFSLEFFCYCEIQIKKRRL